MRGQGITITTERPISALSVWLCYTAYKWTCKNFDKSLETYNVVLHDDEHNIVAKL